MALVSSPSSNMYYLGPYLVSHITKRWHPDISTAATKKNTPKTNKSGNCSLQVDYTIQCAVPSTFQIGPWFGIAYFPPQSINNPCKPPLPPIHGMFCMFSRKCYSFQQDGFFPLSPIHPSAQNDSVIKHCWSKAPGCTSASQCGSTQLSSPSFPSSQRTVSFRAVLSGTVNWKEFKSKCKILRHFAIFATWTDKVVPTPVC